MQYEQNLLQPRIIDTKPSIDLPMRAGITSLYVSVLDSFMFIAFSPFSTAPTRFGKSRYESGPATKSILCLSRSSSCIRSAIQPITPIFRSLLFLRSELKYCKRDMTFCSALSRTEQVFIMIVSASFSLSVIWYPSDSIMAATTSLSATFI